MGYPRLSRFKRNANIRAILLTDRDREIIQLVYRHRFLRSNQIGDLIGYGTPQLLRRLQLLYHHGYLERPRAQLDYYHQGGSRYIVYGLGDKGSALLKQELSIPFPKLSWGEKNRAVGRVFLEHALFVSECMVTLELACRQREGVRLLWGDELHAGKPFNWKVKLNSQVQLGVIPDRAFVLEFHDTDGRQQHVLYFLEADRGTMPVIRKNLAQTSLYRKLLAYEATWSQGIHRSRFGHNRFRVIIVTKSTARVKSLAEACSKLERGHGLFLFADQSILKQPTDLLSTVWQTGRDGESSTLLS